MQHGRVTTITLSIIPVSIPFSSGQRMQRGGRCPCGLEIASFNPLFIGSKDATVSTCAVDLV